MIDDRPVPVTTISSSVREVLENGTDPVRTSRALRRLRREGFDLVDSLRIVRWFESRGDSLNFERVTLTALSSFTLNPLAPMIRAVAYSDRLNMQINFGPYNQFEQVLHEPQIVKGSEFLVIAMQVEDMFVRPLTPHVDEAVARLDAILTLALEKTDATVLVSNFVVPTSGPFGVFESSFPSSESRTIRRLNEYLDDRAGNTPRLVVLDVDSLAADHGKAHWVNVRQRYETATPWTGIPLQRFADLIVRVVQCYRGRLLKCLVLDCDNTLWGGVLGEDGLEGIQLGTTFPGSAYVHFQQYLTELHDRGVLLALCSKNNETDVWTALNDHPAMVLRPSHFVAVRSNWHDKVSNLNAIAQELSIGLDSIAFADDSPVEIAAVEHYLPEITTFLVPTDPSAILKDFKRAVHWDTLTVSAEDRERPAMYLAQRERARLAQTAGNLDDFYSALEMNAVLTRATASMLPRLSQLSQRTNQFNLTTIRYSQQELEVINQNRAAGVFGITLKDRFGNNGLVSLLILLSRDRDVLIDTFLMSCRVIGRTLEQSILAFARDWANEQGALRLLGKYVPTPKNQLVADLYSRLGFQSTETPHLWSQDVTRTIPYSPWIEWNVQEAE